MRARQSANSAELFYCACLENELNPLHLRPAQACSQSRLQLSEFVEQRLFYCADEKDVGDRGPRPLFNWEKPRGTRGRGGVPSRAIATQAKMRRPRVGRRPSVGIPVDKVPPPLPPRKKKTL